MATRLYFRLDKAYFPRKSTNWDMTFTDAEIPKLFMGLNPTKATDVTVSSTSVSFPYSSPTVDIFFAGFVTPPLAAQSISGTLSGQSRARCSYTSNMVQLQAKAYLIDGTTGAIKSTLYSGYSGALVSELDAYAMVNRKVPVGGAAALTTQTAVAGDRILIMMGSRLYRTAGYNTYFDLGSITGTDLPVDETTTSGDPWMEFSGTLTFLSDVSTLGFEEQDRNWVPSDRLGDMRALWGEQDRGGAAPVPTTLQTWPRGNYKTPSA